MTRPSNVIFFFSDNHNAAVMGCAGHPCVQTPNMDRIALDGVRFVNAYCASPLCCPSRAALATGRYPHQTGLWDNAIVYDGTAPSWMHRIRDQGHDVVSVGKLHFRATEDDNGFSEERLPMHILNGRGGVHMLLRGFDREPKATGQWELYVEESGIGNAHYQDFDENITASAIEWLRDEGATRDEPWVLFVSYPSPHPSFRIPKRLWDLYPLEDMPLPPQFHPGERPMHPALEHLRGVMDTQEMTDEDALRRVVAGYCGLITHVDEQMGAVLGAAEELGLLDTTRIMYSSDHGDLHGAHGLFGKSCLYEGSVDVPLLMSGPGIPKGRTVEQVVSHVDLFPTMVEAVGAELTDLDADLPGISLWPAIGGDEQPRTGFAEYHAAGSKTGSFMLRDGSLKLIYHVGMPSQLFDLSDDPNELRDLATDASGVETVRRLEAILRTFCDPEGIDARAKAAQRAKANHWGGLESILKEGTLVITPPPGIEADLRPTE